MLVINSIYQHTAIFLSGFSADMPRLLQINTLLEETYCVETAQKPFLCWSPSTRGSHLNTKEDTPYTYLINLVFGFPLWPRVQSQKPMQKERVLVLLVLFLFS